MKSLICTLVLFHVLSVVLSLPYTKDSGVINLTKKNFAEEVFGSEYVWIVEFYAPWCGHCKNLAPEYEKLAKNLKGIVKVAAVNGDEERELSGAYDVKGFPTIKVFPSKMKPNPKGQGFVKDPIDYNGQRTAAAMSDFVLNQMPNFVTTVNAKSVDKFMESKLPKVLLFTNKKEVTHMFKAIAIEYHHGLEFGSVRDTEKALVEEYGVTKYPTLVVIPKEGEHVVYSGDLKQEPIVKFLSTYAPEKAKKAQKEEPKATPPPEKKTPPRNVREEVVDQKTFENLCYDKNAICVVTLLDKENTTPDEHERYLKVVENVAKKNGETFIFVWIDGIKQYDFAEKLNIASGFPNIVLLHQKKSAMIPYRGSFSEESVNEFLGTVTSGRARPSALKVIPPLASSSKDEL